MHTIGVFDSGIGGLSVAHAIERALPDDTVIWMSDAAHAPYGNKAPSELRQLAMPILQALVARGCEVIVVACNTVTTNLMAELRQQIDVPLIGIEPMIKPAAALTKSGVIAVCATPATLASRRYAWLKRTYAAGVRVLEPDCSGWAAMIERNDVHEDVIAREIKAACAAGADVIVLGCTHYHWIEQSITRLAAGRAAVLQPEAAIVKRLKQVLAENQSPRVGDAGRLS